MIDLKAAHDLAVSHGMTPEPNWDFEGFVLELTSEAEEKGFRGGLNRASQTCTKLAGRARGAADRVMEQVQRAIRDGNKAKAEECLGARKALLKRMAAMEHTADEIDKVVKWDDHGSALVRFHANGAALIHNPAGKAIHQAALQPEVRADFAAMLTVEEFADRLAKYGADRTAVIEAVNLILFGVKPTTSQGEANGQ